ncbi:acyl-CoA synthetase [Embleya sp. NPDC050154]|uniref:acyl-CoA synthetase n=1 Tax=unclassified Embleya TaxID=2699296 RepID=UPI00378D79A0
MSALVSLDSPVPDRFDAVTVAGEAMSREALFGAATALADRIAGAPAVALRADASSATVVATLAGLIAGVPVVPVPPDSGPLERAHILSDSGAVLLLAPGPWTDTGLPTMPVDLTARSASTHREPAPDTTALILYTSGTTGPPKGVLIPHAAIAAGLDGLAEAWAWTADDVLVHGLPLFHVHGLVLGVLGALRVGSRVVHTGRPTPAAYAQAGGSMYFGVPTVWSRVTRDEDSARALAGARLLVSGSAPLPVPVFERLTELTGHRPIERYGMTETLITVSTRADGERRPGFVGLPIAGVRTRLVGEDGSACPYDGETVGELQIDSPTLFQGYLNRPDATAETLTPDGWFRTGDVAVIDAEGRHRIVGRASTDLIKTGGYRVGAGEVEASLLAHPAVHEAAVIGVAHPDLGQEIVAFVVSGAEVTERQLIDHVASGLSVHKRPRRVVFVTDLPRNAMGKVQKKLLTD